MRVRSLPLDTYVLQFVLTVLHRIGEHNCSNNVLSLAGHGWFVFLPLAGFAKSLYSIISKGSQELASFFVLMLIFVYM